MALECMYDSQIEKLLLAGTVMWDKYNFYYAEKCGVLWVTSILSNEKQDSAISSTQF
jgi:hypothetical protein